MPFRKTKDTPAPRGHNLLLAWDDTRSEPYLFWGAWKDHVHSNRDPMTHTKGAPNYWMPLDELQWPLELKRIHPALRNDEERNEE